MKNSEISAEQYEQMIQDLESGAFVPTANEDTPGLLYFPYDSWEELLETDELARDEVISQYYSFINRQ